MQAKNFRKGAIGLATKGRSQQVGQVDGLFFNGPPPPNIQVLLRDQPNQVGKATDGVYDRAPNGRSAIVYHPKAYPKSIIININITIIKI